MDKSSGDSIILYKIEIETNKVRNTVEIVEN